LSPLWKLRIAIARWLLSGGPEGYDYYFHRQRVELRSGRTLGASTGILAADWSEVLEAGIE
jgi:hypothetical protein